MRILKFLLNGLVLAVMIYGVSVFLDAHAARPQGEATATKTETAILRGEVVSLQIELTRLRKELEIKVDDPQRRAQKEFQEVAKLLEQREEAEAEMLAYFVIDDLGGRRCSQRGVRLRDDNSAFPRLVRDAFFRGSGKYVIAREEDDGSVEVICRG